MTSSRLCRRGGPGSVRLFKPGRPNPSSKVRKQKATSMIHKRLRPFNTKQTYPEQNLNNDLSQGVVARGTIVFLRGQVSQALDTRESLYIGDPGKQTAKTMQNIKMLLEEAGSDLSHICRVVVYLTDICYREAVYQEMGKWLRGVFPCSTGLVVSALARPEWVVEIEVTAVIPDDT
jgi:enamine deaminase RidA (YjgF/YER057c/UK114 family)